MNALREQEPGGIDGVRHDLKAQAVAVTDYMNSYGRYDRRAIDPVAMMKGGPGNCVSAVVVVVEEMKEYFRLQRDAQIEGRDISFYVGFPDNHGKAMQDGAPLLTHMTLFAVESASKTVLEMDIMAYEHIPPAVKVETSLSNMLRGLDDADLTKANEDPEFVDTYTVNKEGEAVAFRIMEYEDGVNTYTDAVGAERIDFDELRRILPRYRHNIGGFVAPDVLPAGISLGCEIAWVDEF
jgi:hypothetical protein